MCVRACVCVRSCGKHEPIIMKTISISCDID